MTARKQVEREQDRVLPECPNDFGHEDARFAGLVLLTAALGDVASELKVINRRLERLMTMTEEREHRTWRIRVGR